MNDKIKKLVEDLQEQALWATYNEWDVPITLGDNLNTAADLIEALAAELEQVKRERDGLSIMLTSAMSAAHTFKRKLEEAGHKSTISPLVQGRMNGRHDGYNVLFSAIDEIPEKPCDACVNHNWDMPQCRECNSTNSFRWYVKEEI